MSRFSKFYSLVMTGSLVLLSFILKAQTAEVWLTTGSGSSKLAQQSSVTFGSNSGSSTTINVNENTAYQTMDGFGFTLTEGSAEVLTGLSSGTQSSLLNELFSSGGIGISMVRISIGASDLSSSSYSYRDGASFSLAGPDLTYLIPMIKKILAINPNIKILATPWSPPRWMKTNGGWVGGSLNASNYGDYAQYFLDYLNAMKAQGINIWAITPQNEPENPYNEPSMTMSASEQVNFVNNYLGPKIRNAGYTTKIIGYDHNCDDTTYPTTVANGSSYIDGTAFHLYAGNISALTTVKNATSKNVYFTEQWTSSSGSFGGDLSWHTQNVTIGASNNWARTVFEWNLANNSSLGPHTPGGCTQCLGAITINNSTSFTRNVGYYIIAHFSKFVGANAMRIAASSNHGNLITTAFKNNDGSKAVVVLNNSASSLTFRIVWNNKSFTYTLDGGNVVSFKWTGTSTSNTPINSIITLKGSNNMFVSGENGTQAMNCNRASAGAWEQFKVVDAGNGKIGLQSMSKFVSSENGAATGITCNRTTVGGSGSWEQFDWVVNADGKISLRGNNGLYISSNNGAGVMTCDRPSIGGWEAFTYTVVGTGRIDTNTGALAATALPITKFKRETDVYPNPLVNSKFRLTLGLENQEEATVTMTNSDGRIVLEKRVRDLDSELELEKSLNPGIYYVQIRKGDETVVKRVIVK
jgi:glucosylceramidase